MQHEQSQTWQDDALFGNTIYCEHRQEYLVVEGDDKPDIR